MTPSDDKDAAHWISHIYAPDLQRITAGLFCYAAHCVQTPTEQVAGLCFGVAQLSIFAFRLGYMRNFSLQELKYSSNPTTWKRTYSPNHNTSARLERSDKKLLHVHLHATHLRHCKLIEAASMFEENQNDRQEGEGKRRAGMAGA